MRLKSLVFAASFVLAGCTTLPPAMQKSGTPTQLSPAQVQAVRDGIRMRLKDPMSAMFSDQILAAVAPDGEITACGLVNAKNSYGGYTGLQVYIVLLQGNTVVDATIDSSQYSIVENWCAQRGIRAPTA